MSSNIRWITFDLSCRNVESQPVHVMSSQGGYAKLFWPDAEQDQCIIRCLRYSTLNCQHVKHA